MEVRSKVWLERKGKLFFGTGRALLLEAIKETGSINKAAKITNMSYRRAWSQIHSAEDSLGQPLLIKNKGGKDGGGAILTDFARDLLKRFKKLEYQARLFTNRRYKDIFYK